MESSTEDGEVLSRAIEKLLDEKRKREAAGDPFIEDDDDQLLLSRLFLELKSPKPIGTIKEEEEEEPPSKGKGVIIEEIAKDIKKVKRQNTITHVLLSTMIILTLAWQLSEFSMVFILKERLSHPVRSFGGMLSGIFKGQIRPTRTNFPVPRTKTTITMGMNQAWELIFKCPSFCEILVSTMMKNDEDRILFFCDCQNVKDKAFQMQKGFKREPYFRYNI